MTSEDGTNVLVVEVPLELNRRLSSWQCGTSAFLQFELEWHEHIYDLMLRVQHMVLLVIKLLVLNGEALQS